MFAPSPGRIIHEEPVKFERPRSAREIRRDPMFEAQWDQLWALIETGVRTKEAS